MDILLKRQQSLAAEIESLVKRLRIDVLSSRLADIEKQMQHPDFWQDNQHAQQLTKDAANLKIRVTPWLDLQKRCKELGELIALKDEQLSDELNHQIEQLEVLLSEAKKTLRFNGPYDDHAVILSIHAGAGGTDAQDWAHMLLRMYSRWAERNETAVTPVEQSVGEEAGIKSATIEMSGAFTYGRLRGEHGVHRLVRLSPFNSDHLRQTSFAKVEVLPKIERPEEVQLEESELKIDVFRAGGHGGQSVNTTDSAVRITHIPTGITVSIQNERSQLQNKETALTILRSRLAQLQLEQHQEQLDAIKGPSQSAEWGNQIRSYVLHPYKQVKDLRTRHESSDPESVLDGELNPFIDAYLEFTISS